MADFTPEEKAEAFDRIAAQYYNRNFGTMMKSSLDTLMFSIYLDHCKQNGDAADDYSLSKQLGIGQAKIRALKQNEALQINQSRAVHWKTQFAQYAKNGDNYIGLTNEDTALTAIKEKIKTAFAAYS